MNALEPTRWSIQIIAWNEVAYLSDLLSSLSQQTHWSGQTIIIDNATPIGIQTWARTHWPQTTVLRNFSDKGFARSRNQAIELALSRWPQESWHERFVCLLHPDTIFEPHCLERIERAFIDDPSLMLAEPRVLRARVSYSAEGEQREVEFTDTPEEDGPVCCLFLRASALSNVAVKGLWFEERATESGAMKNFLKRARKVGYETKRIEKAAVWHHAHGVEDLDKNVKKSYSWYQKLFKHG